MRNNIKSTAKIKYVKLSNYYEAKDRLSLNRLKTKVKEYLKSLNKPLINISTGLHVIVNSRSIGKILFPAPYFNPFIKEYIINLNVVLKIEDIFAKAIYIDSYEMQKEKEEKEKFHHFVSPVILKGQKYRVFITICERKHTKIIYMVNTEPYLNASDNSNDIEVSKLVNDVKLYNYQTANYDYYDLPKMQKDNIIKEPRVEYSGCF